MNNGSASESTDSVSVILTPIQLAAVLEREDVTWHETLSSRLWGAVKVLTGATELVGAAALIAAPDPTLVTKVAGGALVVHGSDTLATGLRQVWSGSDEATATQQVATKAAQALGADDQNAARIGVAVDIAVPLLTAAAASAARIGSITGGRISLLEHEAMGGHTMTKHVAQREEQLRARLLAERRIPAATTYRSLASAEEAISDALRVNAARIRTWSARATEAQRLRITYTSPKSIGYGVVRATDRLVEMREIIIVLVKINRQGKTYFVLTSYPTL
jgi:hypothetical protein